MSARDSSYDRPSPSLHHRRPILLSGFVFLSSLFRHVLFSPGLVERRLPALFAPDKQRAKGTGVVEGPGSLIAADSGDRFLEDALGIRGIYSKKVSHRVPVRRAFSASNLGNFVSRNVNCSDSRHSEWNSLKINWSVRSCSVF